MRLSRFGRGAAMPWLAAFTLLAVPSIASAQTQTGPGSPIRAMEVRLPPWTKPRPACWPSANIAD